MTVLTANCTSASAETLHNPLEPSLRRAFDLSDDMAIHVANAIRASEFIPTCSSLCSADLTEDVKQRADGVRRVFGFIDNDAVVDLLVSTLRSSVHHISCMKTPGDRYLTFYSEP